jgi:hypothetical protein
MLKFVINRTKQLTEVAVVQVSTWTLRIVDPASDDQGVIRQAARAISSVIYENPEEKESDIKFRLAIREILDETNPQVSA